MAKVLFLVMPIKKIFKEKIEKNLLLIFDISYLNFKSCFKKRMSTFRLVCGECIPENCHCLDCDGCLCNVDFVKTVRLVDKDVEVRLCVKCRLSLDDELFVEEADMELVDCTVCREKVMRCSMNWKDRDVCNDCWVCCSDRYCMESKDLKKGFAWNSDFNPSNLAENPFIKEFWFCPSCYDNDCFNKCKGCKKNSSFADLQVKYGGGFGNKGPEYEQLFCKTCVSNIDIL